MKSQHINSMSKIGCHVSIAGGIFEAPKRAGELGCEVFQMFTRSPRGGSAPALTPEVIANFKSEMKKYNQQNCYIHTPYYINFASTKEDIREASIRIIREELERGSLIGAKYIMTHLGSAGELQLEEALKITARGIKSALKSYKGSTVLLLEISAGAGKVLGVTFEDLDYLLKNTSDRVGICLDSAHMFASGYDIKTEKGIADVLKKIKSTVGLDKIKLLHSNDSKIDLGGKRDRHDHIGDGKIGKEGFVNLMKALPGVDFILETEHDKVKEDIKSLKNIRKNLA